MNREEFINYIDKIGFKQMNGSVFSYKKNIILIFIDYYVFDGVSKYYTDYSNVTKKFQNELRSFKINKLINK